MSLPEALERTASALQEDADAIRPANGDPVRLLGAMDAGARTRVLTWLLNHEPEAAAELSEAWADAPEGRDAVLNVDDTTLPKPGRKVLRRARHQLRSRGVQVPERAASPRVATLAPVEDKLSDALVSRLDGRGSRLVYLLAPDPAGGARVFEMVLDEERGVAEFEVYTSTRSKARRMLRDISQREGLQATHAPADAVRALLQRIADSAPEDPPLPSSFVEWRSRLGRAPEGTPTPGELARAALGGPVNPSLARRAAELVEGREAGPWLAPSEALRATAQELVDVRDGKVVISGVQKQMQVEEVLGKALEEIFGAKTRERMAARFDETAYVLWKAGRDEDARACLAAGQLFRDVSPPQNPVARAILQVVLAPILDELREAEAASPLVKA